jgi:uncharacterized protein (DUF433 family)
MAVVARISRHHKLTRARAGIICCLVANKMEHVVMLSVVGSAAEAEGNVSAFESQLRSNLALQARLGTFKAWYAVEVEGGSVMLGPSKFVGYRNVDASTYVRDSGGGGSLHGHQTEGVLSRWFAPVPAGSALHRRLLRELKAMFAPYGRQPNRATRFGFRRASADISPERGTGPMAPVDIERWIVNDPDICFGKPTLKGTRIRVSDILGLLAAGETREDLGKNYPSVRPEHIAAALAYAANALDHSVIRAA